MSIDFASMQVDDKMKMPAMKSGAENQQVYRSATEYARTAQSTIQPQFEVSGNDDGKRYWLTRIR